MDNIPLKSIFAKMKTHKNHKKGTTEEEDPEAFDSSRTSKAYKAFPHYSMLCFS